MKKTFFVLCFIFCLMIPVTTSAYVSDGEYSVRIVSTYDNIDINGYSVICVDNTFYLSPLALIYQMTPENQYCDIIDSDNNNSAATWSHMDRYGYKTGYVTVWDTNNKARVSGHDVQLKNPTFVIDGWVPYISVDDFATIYGFDVNIWAEKNTIYFTRNGKGLFYQYS